jgi:hypothetical protein
LAPRQAGTPGDGPSAAVEPLFLVTEVTAYDIAVTLGGHRTVISAQVRAVSQDPTLGGELSWTAALRDAPEVGAAGTLRDLMRGRAGPRGEETDK